MLYMMLFEGRNALSNRWGKHYTGWIVALFILTLLQDQVVPWEGFFYLLLQISKLGVLVFTSLSLFSYKVFVHK